MLVGTDSGIPGNFHTDSTWRELDTWVQPRRDADAGDRGRHALARALPEEGEGPRHARARPLADVIAVRGDVLADVALLQRVDVVVKNGVRVR